jgi:hypothetical protein
MNGELLRKFSQRSITLDGGKHHFRREGRRVVPAGSSAHCPSRFVGTACPLSGKTSTNRPVQICGAQSNRLRFLDASAHASWRTGDDASTVMAPRSVTVACKAVSVGLYCLPSAGVLLRE